MSFLLKDVIHGVLADSVYNEILSRRSNYYYYISRVLPWPNPITPETPETTKAYEDDTRNKIISVKRVSIADVSYVVRRINWTSGTVYDQFDDYNQSYTAYSGATSLKNSNFYVLTDDFNVYKCIFNNLNSPSTEKPISTDPATITMGDGYVWKFMYTIPLSLRTKFLTDDFIPVQKAVLNPFYSDGQINRVDIDIPGSGYLGNSIVSLVVNGSFKSGNGNAVANVFAVFDDYGSIDRVYIKDRGNNYQSANILIVDNANSGVSKYYGLANVLITNPGSGYFSNVVANTTATFVTTGIQPNSVAVVSLVFSSNALTGVNIIDAGSGYTPVIAGNTTLQISTTGTALPVSNASVTLGFNKTAVLKPRLKDGQIDYISVEDPGINYSANIQTTIVVTGDGSNAYLIPYVSPAGDIQDVIIANRGEGYSYADLEVVGDGVGANLSVQLSSGDLDTTQATVELSAIAGGIHAFRINSGGNSYANANITIIGDGTGFLGNVVLDNANSVSYITVSNPGSGYTYANVIIGGTSGSNANIVPIFSPVNGHGSDAIRELFAETLIFYSTINDETIHNVDVDNDYRQFGLIKDIEQFGNRKSFSNALGTSCFLVTTNTVVNSLANVISRDTVLELSANADKKFEVIEVISANSQLLLNSVNNYTLQASDQLYDNLTASTFVVQAINKIPTINKFSGDLIFIDNRTSVSYSDEQLVTLRTTLRL